MKGASPKGMAETSGAMQEMPSNADLISLVKLLITEVKEVFNARLDTLNERITLQNEENGKLHEENNKLKDIVITQEKKIEEL